MKFTFHRFNIAETDDPDVMAGFPIAQWQETVKGQWVMENAHNLTYHQKVDDKMWGYDIIIRGELHDPRKITEYLLRWGH